jgi:sortase A
MTGKRGLVANLRRLVERTLLLVGVLLIVVYGSARLFERVSGQKALANFDRVLAKDPEQNRATVLIADQASDFSLWSEKRIHHYRDTLQTEVGDPVAVLSIAKLQLRVPVFEGTSDPILNRGVGRIIGTAKIGQKGNIGIAGHRDGFFRGLKDIAPGDILKLTTTEQRETYVVDEIEIVGPTDVRVLQPRKAPSVTLVTCYPFYFIGSAPQRFIVHASLRSTKATSL